ncbi:MAG: riboflavin biosynthesis protein RibD [Desulfobulbus propionicus]|nr:MAG: riboflavin biosynthesis protein RibD [Desulfobulbus propionicus]
MQSKDEQYMQLAIEQAKKGRGRTSPNPAVGAVIVKDGVVIGKGYHKKAGTPHAEIHAIADAKESVEGATIYVTLEPCSHTGRTPPCTEAIIRNAFGRVVVGMEDPNPLVSGRGLEQLRAQGIHVRSRVLEHECRALNFPFLKHITTGLPWVIMKAGVSLDGRLAYERGKGGKVTGREVQQVVHGLRDQVDAILIGVETALIDDPSLTTRLENDDGQDPLRIVLDSHLRSTATLQLFHQDSTADTWVYCLPSALQEKQDKLEQSEKVRVFRVGEETDEHVAISAVLHHLGSQGINSVLVEGGARIHGAFLQADLVDQVYLFYAPFFIGDGGVPLVSGQGSRQRTETFFVEQAIQQVGNDFLFTGVRRYPIDFAKDS